MKLFGALGKTAIVVFAVIGIVFSGVFVSMRFGWLNVKGSIAERNSSFFKNTPVAESMNDNNTQAVVLCKVHALANYAPETAKKIQTVYKTPTEVADATSVNWMRLQIRSYVKLGLILDTI
jgi:hypothetical protein